MGTLERIAGALERIATAMESGRMPEIELTQAEDPTPAPASIADVQALAGEAVQAIGAEKLHTILEATGAKRIADLDDAGRAALADKLREVIA